MASKRSITHAKNVIGHVIGAKGQGRSPAYSLAEVNKLKGEMVGMLQRALPQIEEGMVNGTLKTPQVNLIKIIVDKVIPTMDMKAVQVNHTHTKANELTREDLEKIATGQVTIDNEEEAD